MNEFSSFINSLIKLCPTKRNQKFKINVHLKENITSTLSSPNQEISPFGFVNIKFYIIILI